MRDYGQLLKRALTGSHPNAFVFIASGSPCQDFTYLTAQGILGPCGPRSVHFHIVVFILHFAPIWFPGMTFRLMGESAGSMRIQHRSYMARVMNWRTVQGSEDLNFVWTTDAAHWSQVQRRRIWYVTLALIKKQEFHRISITQKTTKFLRGRLGSRYGKKS